MKCPKCNYVSFDYLDTCKKCGYNLAEFREERGIKVIKPKPIDVFSDKEKEDEALKEPQEVSETPSEKEIKEEGEKAIEIGPTLKKDIELETRAEEEEKNMQARTVEPIELEEPGGELEIEKGMSETEEERNFGGDKVVKEERIIELEDIESDQESQVEEALSEMEKEGGKETEEELIPTELGKPSGEFDTEKQERAPEKKDKSGDEVTKEGKVIELEDIEDDAESLVAEALLEKKREEKRPSAEKEEKEESEESSPKKQEGTGGDSEVEKSDSLGQGEDKKGIEDKETGDVSEEGGNVSDVGPSGEEGKDQEDATKEDDEGFIKKKDLRRKAEAQNEIPKAAEEVEEEEELKERNKKTEPVAVEKKAEGTLDAKAEAKSERNEGRADFKKRLLANIFDLCLLGLINIIFIVLSLFTIAGWDLVFSDFFSVGLLSSQFSFSKLIFIFLFLLIFTGYFVYFQWRDGQTIGKMLLKVRVVSVDGEPLTLWKAFQRSFFYLASILTLGIGFFWIKFDKNNEAWYDKISKTHVVKLHS